MRPGAEQAAETAPDEHRQAAIPRRTSTRPRRSRRTSPKPRRSRRTSSRRPPTEIDAGTEPASRAAARPGPSLSGHVVALEGGQFPRGRVRDPEAALGQRRIRGHAAGAPSAEHSCGEHIGEVLPVQAQDGRTASATRSESRRRSASARSVREGKTGGAAVRDQAGLSLDGPPEPRRVRAHGLDAAQRGRADHPRGGREAGQQAGQRPRVGRPVRVERPRLVLAGPVLLASRPRRA